MNILTFIPTPTFISSVSAFNFPGKGSEIDAGSLTRRHEGEGAEARLRGLSAREQARDSQGEKKCFVFTLRGICGFNDRCLPTQGPEELLSGRAPYGGGARVQEGPQRRQVGEGLRQAVPGEPRRAQGRSLAVRIGGYLLSTVDAEIKITDPGHGYR